MNKNKIIAIVVLLVAIVIIGGYLLLKSTRPPESKINVNNGIIPSLGESTNPLKNKPDINPINTSNPFRSIKTNPFK